MQKVECVEVTTYKTSKKNFFVDIVRFPETRETIQKFEVWIYDATLDTKDIFVRESGDKTVAQLLAFVEEHLDAAIESYYSSYEE